MTDLSTSYLGMRLRSPLVPAASPLSEDTDNIKRMEDAGAGAVVFHSLFEEQITQERFELHHHLTYGTESYAEALSYFPEPSQLTMGPETYLEHIKAAKLAVDIPIIASLNGASEGGWIDYARHIEEAGADALELNIYNIPTDLNLSGAEVEQSYLNIVSAVCQAIKIPVAVKLSPFFSSFANMAMRFEQAGAGGLVLFNRFYQPDIDLEELEVHTSLLLSAPLEMRLPLAWIGILHGRIAASLAATRGIHRASDVLKMIMVGADITQLCSILLRHGIEHLSTIETDLRSWMDEHEYHSIEEMKGSLSQRSCPDPTAYERAQYMSAIHSWHPNDQSS